MPISRGVRKVSENIMADGRSIIITSKDKNDYDFANLPAGTIHVDTSTGAAYVKKDNGTNWEPLVVSKLTADIQGLVDSISQYSGRIDQLEMEQAAIYMKLKAQNELPDASLVLVEDFSNPTTIDQTEIKVTSIVSASDAIDVENLDGVILGSHYIISDGDQSETIVVKATSKNGSIYRIIASDVVKNTYNIPETKMYRSTAQISSSSKKVIGSETKKVVENNPNFTWKGISANVASELSLNTTISNRNSFTVDGDGTFNSNGEITLQAS